MAGKLIDSDPELARQHVQDIMQMSRKTLSEVREAVANYRHAKVSDEMNNARLGFEVVNIRFEHNELPCKLTPDIESELAWIIREGTTNVMRHANAGHCRLNFSLVNKEQLLMSIKDDGSSVNTNSESLWQQAGTGIRSIQRRCHNVDADFQIKVSSGVELKIVVGLR